MNIDTEKIDEPVLALLYRTLHDGSRAWKGFDRQAMNRLYEKGFISSPVGKAESVLLTDKGSRIGAVIQQALRKAGALVPFAPPLLAVLRRYCPPSPSSLRSTCATNPLLATNARIRCRTSSRRPRCSAAVIVCEYAAHTSALLTS